MSSLGFYRTMTKRFGMLKQLWYSLNGDAAYERYLTHWHVHHAQAGEKPLSRKAFFVVETQRKWNGIKRCC